MQCFKHFFVLESMLKYIGMIVKGEISMKKINLNEYVKTSNFIKPVSTEDINGGCILVLGGNNYGF